MGRGGMRGGGGRMGGSRGGGGRGLGSTGGGRGGFGGGPGPRGGGFGPAGGGFGGGFGGPRMGWGPGFGWGGGWRRRRGGFFMGGGGPSLFIVLAIIGAAIAFSAVPQGAGRNVTPSTIDRQALPQGSAIDSGPMFTDHIGWIGNPARLLPGMRNFFQRTGVRPHLYLVGEIYGTITPTNAQLESFANARYSELFDDEAHMLFLFFRNARGQYGMWAAVGNQAQSVMDGEALDILMDFVQRYYYDRNVGTEEMFSRSFDQASGRIMTVTRSPWIPVLVLAGLILILLLLLGWWKRAKEQKNLEAEQTERILGQSLDTFESSPGAGSDPASRLAEKYGDKAAD